jgi:sterol desaturase/sphingolipid hydroxylase (fatty acid hydroxylase superfamily)
MLHSKDLWQVHKIHHGKPHTELQYNDTNVGHWFENIFSPIGLLFPCFFIFDIYGLTTASALTTIGAHGSLATITYYITNIHNTILVNTG